MSKDEVKNLRGPRVNAVQKDYVTEYMASHTSFAAGKFTVEMGAEHYKTQWEKVAEEANNKGPKKTVQQWKKVWLDIKKRSKDKVTAIKAQHRKTGNFPDTSEPLTAMDRKVLSVIGSDAVEGLRRVADSLPENVSELRKLIAGDHTPLHRKPVDEVSVFEAYGVIEKTKDLTKTNTNTSSIPTTSIDEHYTPSPPTHTTPIPTISIDEHYTPSPPTHTTPIPTTSIDEHHIPTPPTHIPHIPTTYIDEQHARSPPSHTPPIPTTYTDEQHTRSPPTHTPSLLTVHSPSTNQPHSTSQNQVKRKRRTIMTKRKISDTRAEQFFDLQQKQNEILETMSKAMMKTAENEEKKIRIASEEIEIKRQKLEEHRKTNSILAEVVNLLSK